MYILFWVSCVLIFTLWWNLKRKKTEKEPPMFPGALPFVGHAHLFFVNYVELWQLFKSVSYFTMKVGGVARFNLGPKHFYVISDTEDFIKTMTTHFNKSFLQEISVDWIGNGILTEDVPPWKNHRKLFGPVFTPRAVLHFLDIFNTQSRRLIEEMAVEVGKGQFNQHSYILNNILETINQTILGLKSEDSKMVNKNYASDIDNILDILIEKIQKIWLYIPFLYKISDVKKRKHRIIDKTKALTYAIIQKRKSEHQAEGNVNVDNVEDKYKTVMDVIMESFAGEEGITDEDIRQHLETFIIGGFHTTSAELALVLKEIGRHPEVQERIYEEIDEVFGHSNRDVEKDDLAKLKYLEIVCKEIVRLHPVIPIILRGIDVDLKLKNYTIPRGSTVIASIFGVNRLPAWGADAEEFRPERWLEPDLQPNRLFVGFSVGRRNCIGMNYAIVVMKTMLVHIFRRYRVVADNTEMVMKWNAVLHPISGHHIALELRS